MRATRFISWGYNRVLKPFFFRRDAEKVHDSMLGFGRFLGSNPITRGLIRWLFVYEDPILAQRLAGLNFPNPIGLPAGFDKNGRLWKILPAVGFGFIELGSITAKASKGNPRPRLSRWEEGKSLVVNYGLANDGVEEIAKHLPTKPLTVPLGLNVAFTNTRKIATCNDAIADYLTSLKALEHFGDYYTVNVSCPNRLSDRLFIDPANLEALLTGTDWLGVTKPIFLKLSPDLTDEELEEIAKVAERHHVSGFITSNLTKNRARLPESESLPAGGLSGKPVNFLSDKQIRWLFKRFGKKYIIIGAGGVFNAWDAYRKIKLGASLVQVFTGMIYGGPQRIGEINRDLAKLLRHDGYKSISDAVGVEA